MISLQGAVYILIYLVVGAIVLGLLDYLIKSAPFIPDPWKPNIRWVLLALGILVLIGILLSFTGHGPIFRA